uniref:Proton pump-interactor 4 n=1 Tax=Noccaea caerulescens TaxID=107243 RepID=A0A1J3JXV5_NOCCA
MSAPILGFDVRRFVIGKSNGDESSTVTTEEDDDYAVFSGDSLPGDAVEEEEEEEWSGENRLCFYLVKQFAYDDPEIKDKIDEADNEIYQCNSDRIQIANKLKAKRAERLSLVAPMEDLISSVDEYSEMCPHQSMSMEINDIMKEQERLEEIKMEIESLDAQLGCVLDQRDKAFERIKLLRIQRDKGNAAFFQSRAVMKKAMELAASRNVRDLEELASSEVDKFMSLWNNDKAFRDDYKKRILPSLDEQKMRRNGNETAVRKAMERKRFSTEEESDDSMDFDIRLLRKEEEEIDEESLKEKKREEQLEKARLAMERKRKLHEKATAKAAIRVKKEAEKKLKDLEKRAKKKAASNSSSPSDVDRTTETVTETSVNGRSVNSKQRSFRSYRYSRKRNEDVPKAIIKRRKAYRLWIWTVSSAAVALPLALFIVFFYIR